MDSGRLNQFVITPKDSILIVSPLWRVTPTAAVPPTTLSVIDDKIQNSAVRMRLFVVSGGHF